MNAIVFSIYIAQYSIKTEKIIVNELKLVDLLLVDVLEQPEFISLLEINFVLQIE